MKHKQDYCYERVAMALHGCTMTHEEKDEIIKDLLEPCCAKYPVKHKQKKHLCILNIGERHCSECGKLSERYKEDKHKHEWQPIGQLEKVLRCKYPSLERSDYFKVLMYCKCNKVKWQEVEFEEG